MKLISLIGEQPIPNLLPILYLKPSEIVLVDTEATKRVTDRLLQVVRKHLGCSVERITTDPYDIAAELKALDFAGDNIVFNLTGGTKTMSLAAYEVAHRLGSDFVYLQSSAGRAYLYRYNFSKGGPQMVEREEIRELITIDDYLRAHLPGYDTYGFSKDDKGKLTSGGQFEKSVYEAIEQTKQFEVKAGVRPRGVGEQIDIDLVIRSGNSVGIAELKLSGINDKPKQAIDQLNTAGGREYLGIKTAKFLIVAGSLNRRNKELADALSVKVIEIQDYVLGSALTEKSRQNLIDKLKEGLK